MNSSFLSQVSISPKTLRVYLLFGLLPICSIAAAGQSAAPSWVQAFGTSGPGNNISNAIKVGPDQTLYVTGQFSSTADFGGTKLTSAGGLDSFVAKYSRSGTLQWVAQAGGAQDDAVQGLDLDADGNVYVTGSTTYPATFFSANQNDTKITVPTASAPLGLPPAGLFLAKYTSSGTLLWVQTGSSYGPSGNGVAVNSAAGTVYVAGEGSSHIIIFSSADGTSYIVPGFPAAFMALAKYDTNGNFQWVQLADDGDFNLAPSGVAVDSKDNVYVDGWFDDTPFSANFRSANGLVIELAGHFPGSNDAFLVKYDKNGNVQWGNDIGGYTAKPGAVTIGPSGEITLVGYIGNINNGSPSESETIVTSQPPGTKINLGGGIFTNPSNTDEVIATYKPNGVLIRALRRGGSGNENATGVAYDSRDNLYVTGLAERNVAPQLFVDEYSGKNLLWEATADAGIWTGQAANTPALAVDAAGSVFVANGYATKAAFGDLTLSGIGASEAFVAGLNTAYANQRADLFLRIWPSMTTVHQGDLLTYAFPVWNLGPNNAYLEVLNTQVPAGTVIEYIRISGTPGLGTCTRPPYGGTGQIVCHENSAMAPNTTWTVRLTVKVTASSGSTITESAATMADTPDPNMANNTATVSIKVQ